MLRAERFVAGGHVCWTTGGEVRRVGLQAGRFVEVGLRAVRFVETGPRARRFV